MQIAPKYLWVAKIAFIQTKRGALLRKKSTSIHVAVTSNLLGNIDIPFIRLRSRAGNRVGNVKSARRVPGCRPFCPGEAGKRALSVCGVGEAAPTAAWPGGFGA